MAREVTKLAIDGMTCASCSAIIERTLGRTAGVEEIRVNLATGTGVVAYDPAVISLDAILARIRELDFGVAPIDEAHAREQYEARRQALAASQRHDLIVLAVAAVLTVCVVTLSMTPVGERIAMALAACVYGTAHTHEQMMYVMNVAALVLTIPVQFWCGARFYRGAFASARAHGATMDTLVAAGTTIAFIYAVYLTFAPGKAGTMAPFETSAMLITFVLIGKTLEARAKGKASLAMDELLELAPKVALLVTKAGEREVPLDELVPGDTVRVRPGERVAADGVITAGSSGVDESTLTGEALPQEKGVGSEVYAGTLNTTGSFEFTVTAAGGDSTLSHIIQLVEDAQAAKPPIQRLADKISAVFVPVIFAIAALTFVAWSVYYAATSGFDGAAFEASLMAAVSVIVVACPCALGLATPCAVMVGTGLGAKHGILIKDGEALELCAKATDAVFDKTGTLTQGAPKVVAVLTAPASTGAAEAVDAEKGAAAAGIAEKDGEEAGIAEKDGGEAPAAAGADGAAGTAAPFTQAQILEAAAALERASEHPLARAVMAEVEDVTALPQVEGFDSVAGKGVVGHVEGVRWAVGNARLLEELHVALPAWAKAAAAPGVTSMFVAAGECCVARIDVRDTLKPGTRKALLGLKEQGITTWLLSGDAQTSSEAIAQEAGIEPAHVIAQVLPQDKAAHVAALKAEGRVVVMVGDGVNDTPALATADIGMAMGGATDAALEVGSVVLMRDDIASVGRAVKLARATLKKIHQNFFWALAYNCCLVPLAALGILAPEVSGACMALSSVSVVTSSLLLYRLRLD